VGVSALANGRQTAQQGWVEGFKTTGYKKQHLPLQIQPTNTPSSGRGANKTTVSQCNVAEVFGLATQACSKTAGHFAKTPPVSSISGMVRWGPGAESS